MARPPTSLAEAAARAAALRAAGRTLVTTNGCFDLFHAGHLDTLEGARALGDALIVLINSDASVKRFKGEGRPYLDQDQRAALLAALRVVDHVVVFDEDTPLAALEALRPAVHVKGGTYVPERVAAEEALVAGWGGRLVCLPLRSGISSTELLRRIWQDRPVEVG
jgi:rfaE bifunctional protein nucleotidyltransferase chain/domain